MALGNKKRMGRMMYFFACWQMVMCMRYFDVKNEQWYIPIAMVQREEHDGTRQYVIEKIISIKAKR